LRNWRGLRRSNPSENDMLVGTIIRFSGNSGIIRVAEGQDGKSDVLIHRSACSGFAPHAGAEIAFELGKDKRGEVCATDVVLRSAHRSYVDPDSPHTSAGVMKMLGH
jgi:hypothetical protein